MLISLFLSSSLSFSALHTIELSSKETIPSPRWFTDVSPPANKPALNIFKKNLDRELAEVKVAFAKGDYKACWVQAQKVRAKAKEIEPWIVNAALRCAIQSLETNKKLKPNLEAEIVRLAERSQWLHQGPFANLLRQAIIEGLLKLTENDFAKDRSKTWSYLNQLFDWLQFMTPEQKASYYNFVGDLTAIEQKVPATLEYYRRSMALKASIEVQKKIDKIKSESPEVVKEEAKKPPFSQELTEIETRMLEAIKASNFGTAIEDAVLILKKYPETKAAEQANQKLVETLFSVSDESDPKYQPIREKVISEMLSCQADKISRWAKLLFNRGQYALSLNFAKTAIRKLEDVTSILDLMDVAALSAEFSGQLDESIKFNRNILQKYPGTNTANAALLRVGLNYYRHKEYSQAASYLEAYVNNNVENNSQDASSKELIARYWLYRSLQKLKRDTADKQAEVLLDKFSLSYYGILVRAEKNNSVFAIPFEPESEVKAEYWLLSDHEKGWRRLKILVSAGWLEEAQLELRSLPSPVTIAQKITLARFHSAAMEYPPAFRWINEAWDEGSKYRQKSLLTMIFPRDFASTIETFGKKVNLDLDLVHSLIRQESAYAPKAVSRSGALGLMQIIPVTADEISKDLSFKSLKIPEEVFNPKINIQMGTYYLSRMIKRYKGNVALALAAYNAGPTRLDRWLNSRNIGKDIIEKTEIGPDDDLWIDELPWSETSFYVKAILRNLVLYRSLKEDKPINIAKPIWKTQD